MSSCPQLVTHADCRSAHAGSFHISTPPNAGRGVIVTRGTAGGAGAAASAADGGWRCSDGGCAGWAGVDGAADGHAARALAARQSGVIEAILNTEAAVRERRRKASADGAGGGGKATGYSRRSCSRRPVAFSC